MRDGARHREPWVSEEAMVEGAVLALLLAEHPTQLTAAEVVGELVGDPGDFAERDAVEGAMRSLAAVGLVHRRERFVWPSRAALRFASVRR